MLRVFCVLLNAAIGVGQVTTKGWLLTVTLTLTLTMTLTLPTNH